MLRKVKDAIEELREIIKILTRMMFELHELLWAILIVVLVFWEMSRLLQ